MSWLNTSLNTLKGQISNFAQEVLSETAEENQDIEDTQKKNEELNSICATKDNEIASLRKQITELLAKNIELTRASKSSFEKNASLEGSWCLEPENIPSDSSCKNDSSESSTGGDMITVPLDIPAHEADSNEKFHKVLEEKEEKIKKLHYENTTLNDKIYELTTENRTLNASLDELDSQHNDAIQNLLDSKDELKQKCNKLDGTLKILQNKYDLEVEQNQNIQQDLEGLQKKFINLQDAYMIYVKENEDYKTKLNSLEIEKNELLEMYSFKEDELKKIVEKVTADKEFLQKENVDLQHELVELVKEGSQLSAKNSENNSTGTIISDLEVENENLKKNIDILNSKFNNIEKEKTALQETINSISTEKETIESDINTLRNNNLELEKKCESLQFEWEEKYKNLLLEKEQICSDIANLEDFIDVKDDQGKIREEMRNKIELLEKEIAELKSNSSSPSSFSDLEQKYNELILEKGQLHNDFVALEEDFIGVQMEREKIRTEMKSTIDSLEKEISEMKNNDTKSNKNWKQKYDELISEKKQLHNEFATLEEDFIIAQDERDTIRKEFKNKIVSLEKEITDLKNTNRKLIESIKNANEGNSSGQELTELIITTEKLSKENDDYKKKIKELTEGFEKCEANASEVESKLMMENVNLQKQLIDLESSINKNNIENFDVNSFNFDEIKRLFSTFLQIDFNLKDKTELESNLKSIRDKIWKIDVLESNLKEMATEISHLVKEKAAVEHERDTLQADIGHYKIECTQLMENNEILLAEFKNLKHNKLETIPENNEESMVVLEQQIEECNNLNRTLEDEYNELTRKLEEYQLEKQENQIKLNGLQDINNSLNGVIKDLNKQIEILEGEKCNLIFEINEMKTDDKKSAMECEILEYKNKISNLELQLNRLNKDHADLVAAMQTVQSNSIDQNKQNESIISTLEKQIRKLNEILKSKQEDIKTLTIEKDSLKTLFDKSQVKTSDNSSSKEDLSKSTNENELLRDKLVKLENELKDKIVELEKITLKCRENEKNLKTLEEENQNIRKSLETELIKTDNNLELINQQNGHIKELEEKLLLQTPLEEQHINEINQLKQTIEAINKEKNDLIISITAKHNENTQYYTEIQRLGGLLQMEIEKSKTILANCENCKRLQNETSKSQIEIEKLKDQINFLKEKSDILTSNLLSEQTNQKLLRQENMDAIEKKQNLVKDLERLREHLVELEEAHTNETLEMQRVIEEKNSKISLLEEEISKSSNAFTSASIRANQHAETLQVQYSLLSQQRDELAAKLSSAEDKESKNQAALVNLQCALEQFQKEKDKDIESATHRIRKQLESEQEKQEKLCNEIASMQQQLIEANQGLLAAARLSDQLEISQVTIAALKEDITNLQNKNSTLDEKLKNIQSSQEDKVEKSLMKSLLIGYVVSNNQNDKSQILKLISSVLDFNPNEVDKIGLNKTQGGWLTGILGGHNNPNEDSRNKDSLTKAFVNFLERESQPRTSSEGMPNLLNIVADSSSAPSGPTRENSITNINVTTPAPATGIQPILLNENVLDHFAPTRNSSSILKNILNDS